MFAPGVERIAVGANLGIGGAGKSRPSRLLPLNHVKGARRIVRAHSVQVRLTGFQVWLAFQFQRGVGADVDDPARSHAIGIPCRRTRPFSIQIAPLKELLFVRTTKLFVFDRHPAATAAAPVLQNAAEGQGFAVIAIHHSSITIVIQRAMKGEIAIDRIDLHAPVAESNVAIKDMAAGGIVLDFGGGIEDVDAVCYPSCERMLRKTGKSPGWRL
jgi:hypothetical protein